MSVYRGTHYRLEWRGDAIVKAVEEASRRALDETTQACVLQVQNWAGTPHDTGFMKQTFATIAARNTGTRWVAWWGNWIADYTIWQEIGARGRPGRYFIRRAKDIEYPKLPQRVRAWYRRLSR